ncbi:TetR/AcrR family transcriptional regulator [Methanoregula sp.]|uniref:TetR/AcrR family transcriptional regulator n=1 Tax=Methanoregula sp. TaxID=2052170 RepID=UPI003BB136CD
MPRIIKEYREEVRKKIVDTAYSLIIDKGYHGTTMEEIAQRLGVTKPALYQYFPGKENLYAAVTEKSRQELTGLLERSYRNRNIREGSAALFEALADYVPRFNDMYAETLLLAAHNEQMRDLLRQDRIEDLRIVQHFITRQQGEGLVSRTLDPRTLAIACDALINGLLMDIMMGLGKEEAKEIWLKALEQLIREDCFE